MWIDVKIPYEPNNKLAYAYNRAMAESTAPWVLLLDHDIFLACNPYWYDICLNVIESLQNKKVGMITCVTSNTTNECQRATNWAKDKDNIESHIKAAEIVYKEYGNLAIPVDNERHISGFFMLVNRKAWKDVLFRDMGKGVNKIDLDFKTRLFDNEWKIYTLPGLYVYHRRGIRHRRRK